MLMSVTVRSSPWRRLCFHQSLSSQKLFASGTFTPRRTEVSVVSSVQLLPHLVLPTLAWKKLHVIFEIFWGFRLVAASLLKIWRCCTSVQRVLSFSRMRSRWIQTVSGGQLLFLIFADAVDPQWFLECWVMSGAGGGGWIFILLFSPFHLVDFSSLSSSFFLQAICLVMLSATFLPFSSTLAQKQH